MRDDKTLPAHPVRGRVKWFDPAKGFGFIADAEGGADILLHGNVLRSFGQSSIIEGSEVEVLAVQTARGRQATEVRAVSPPPSDAPPPIAELADMDEAEVRALPLLPARVKWFDRNKGFGFANVFGRKGDVFLHIEVLRRFGFADLVGGEAVCLRVFAAGRGMVAAEVAAWEKAVTEGQPLAEFQADAEMLEKMRKLSAPSAEPPGQPRKVLP
ncbi:cold-shock protein [Paracoccus sp. (in: a-proteobacteria)]|uniref:cold-shock protein n=1 Tax=Paracoccus sp. TaxID=267 RepID=UPI0034CFF73D